MTETNSELKNIIEAALLVAGQPLTMEKLLTMFPEESRPTRDGVRAVLQALELEYAERPVELKQIDRAWRFQTRAKYASWVARLAEERPQRYSRALLETLAIIAYRQPVTRGDIEEIRGVGVRDVPGRPALLGTTREFLEHFNLKGLEDLPPLAALRDLAAIGAE